MMPNINLVKYQNRNGGKVLVSETGIAKMQSSGLMIKFPSNDLRKPHHAVILDNEAVKILVDEMLEYLRKE